MHKRIVVIAFIILGAGFFLIVKSHDLFAQPSELGSDGISVQKTGVAEAEETTIPRDRHLHATQEIKYVAGKDGKWFTDDDEIYHYYLATYDDRGKMTKRECLTTQLDYFASNAGDKLQNYIVYKYDAEGGPVKEAGYKKTESGKDLEEYHAVYEHDALGNKTKTIRYDSKGEIIRYITYQYDPQGRIMQDVEYTAKGTDNQWFTADDEIEKYHKREYDNQGKLIHVTECHAQHQGRGPDGQWFTLDDVVSSTKVYAYNNEGLVAKTLKYLKPGPDHAWFTDDDVLQYYTLRYYAKADAEDSWQ
ncbi:MAG TPA: hypothetical protein PL155_01465 [Candidatus Omnitrophota bacterium]|nr:hypothetical protein [Candidatus Omnitrophota bacterium]HPD84845.1 hypothetical protein [Candidatus Omnitrophota bacterium]HRZ03703.1 hypothetical protein [Candidatus Omnitrophota bacterium]